jgi:hypothetical protein
LRDVLVSGLIYSYRGGREKLMIGDLTTSKRKLEHLLKIYRERSENKNDHRI